MKECPKCGSAKVFEGRHFNAISGGGLQYFRPKGLKLITLSGADVPIRNSTFTACLECGMLWSSIKPEDLKKVLSKSGNKKTRRKLEGPEIDAG
jgi:hypothetical protein